MVLKRKCAVCSSEDCRQLYEVKDYRIVKCKHCGFVYLDLAHEQSLTGIYQEEYFKGTFDSEETFNVSGWDYFDPVHYSEVLLHSRQALDTIERFLPPGKILDVGCGPGIFLRETLSKGWDPYGFDISDFAVQYAIEKLGLPNVKKMNVKEMNYVDNSFDVITMFHIIEHVPYPRELLERCFKILKNNGIILVETPDISSKRAERAGLEWKYLKIPEHVNYFSLKILVDLLKKIGFTHMKIIRSTHSTGLMNMLCGGEKKASIFYDGWSKSKSFRFAVKKVRKFKEFISGYILSDYDVVTVIARKP